MKVTTSRCAGKVLATALALGAAACGSDDPASGIPAEPGITKLAAGWNVFEPGGDSTCSRGTPFSFWVRKGSVNRVVVEFRGGGACWNDLTCGIGDSLFEETADPDPWLIGEEKAEGIRDHENARNPFKDWHHVYIPYCTGDIHWGDATQSYGAGDAAFTIHHKGGINTRAVLDWVYENVPGPEKLFVTGCSAGAYGAALWSAHVKNHYPNAQVYQFADSGQGVITDSFFQESFPQWNAQASYPRFIPGDQNFTRLPQLYGLIGNHYPDMPMSAYNTNYDENQFFYFTAQGGGDITEWSTRMRASVAEIEQTTPNFASYIAPDFQHCIVPYDEFYGVESNGVRLVDWLRQMVEDQGVESVDCAPNCGIAEPPAPPGG
jgi:hypothetical protein